ncbi:hypothetical protein GCM10010269_37240 [Streptomyces humidus]|uniref:Uncharacterized protein n=1 Tax=Streptomyces humidus TaxID=52259 RepID=A0A918FWL2_9ACTN|nr:hypothetical protein GCM10010269_37240 [Streptomyces humidus]
MQPNAASDAAAALSEDWVRPGSTAPERERPATNGDDRDLTRYGVGPRTGWTPGARSSVTGTAGRPHPTDADAAGTEHAAAPTTKATATAEPGGT